MKVHFRDGSIAPNRTACRSDRDCTNYRCTDDPFLVTCTFCRSSFALINATTDRREAWMRHFGGLVAQVGFRYRE